MESIQKTAYDEYWYMMLCMPILKDAKVVVETGLGGGHSADVWLRGLSLLSEPKGRVLHTFEVKPLQTSVDRLTQAHFEARWELHVMDSRNGGDALQKGTVIDILYLDAGHDRHEVAAELDTFGPFVGPDGVVLTDDAWDNYPLGSPQQKERSNQFPDGYVGKTDTYNALKAWGDARGWKTLLFMSPLGMALCFNPHGSNLPR